MRINLAKRMACFPMAVSWAESQPSHPMSGTVMPLARAWMAMLPPSV